MLSEFAFANSLAILTGLLYIVFVILQLLAPNLFKFLFNTQFLGADVASLFPRRISAGSFVGTHQGERQPLQGHVNSLVGERKFTLDQTGPTILGADWRLRK
jgi:hypothetical protein